VHVSPVFPKQQLSGSQGGRGTSSGNRQSRDNGSGSQNSGRYPREPPREREVGSDRMLPFQSGGAVRARYDVVMDANDESSEPIESRVPKKSGRSGPTAAWADSASSRKDSRPTSGSKRSSSPSTRNSYSGHPPGTSKTPATYRHGSPAPRVTRPTSASNAHKHAPILSSTRSASAGSVGSNRTAASNPQYASGGTSFAGPVASSRNHTPTRRSVNNPTSASSQSKRGPSPSRTGGYSYDSARTGPSPARRDSYANAHGEYEPTGRRGSVSSETSEKQQERKSGGGSRNGTPTRAWRF